MTRATSLAWLVLAGLLCSGATDAQAGEAATDDGTKEPSHFWIELGLGWAWTHGPDARVGQRSTAVTEGSLFSMDFNVESQPLWTQYARDTSLMGRAGFRGAVWGVDAQLWHLGSGGATDAAFEITRDGEPVESLQVWGASFTNDDSVGEHQFAAESQLSLYAGRLELTRSIGSGATVAVGLHVARFEDERAEALQVTRSPGRGFQLITAEATRFSSDSRGWMYGPSIGVRLAARPRPAVGLSLSVWQSVLFTDVDRGGRVTIRSEILGGLAEERFSLDTRFSSRRAVPVTEAQGAVTVELTGNLSIGLEGLFSVWQDVPLALRFSAAESDGVWVQRRGTLVFARVGPTLRLRF